MMVGFLYRQAKGSHSIDLIFAKTVKQNLKSGQLTITRTCSQNGPHFVFLKPVSTFNTNFQKTCVKCSLVTVHILLITKGLPLQIFLT